MYYSCLQESRLLYFTQNDLLEADMSNHVMIIMYASVQIIDMEQ